MNYGAGWKRIKAEVRARDEVCRECGKAPAENGRALDVHHVAPFRFTADNSLDNLVALCRSCHMRADDHGRSGSAGFLRSSGNPSRPTKREIRRLKQLVGRAEGDAARRGKHRMAAELRAQGNSLRHIADRVGVSRQTILNWLSTPDERITRRARMRARATQRRATAKRLQEEGLSLRTIAEELDVSHQSVAKMLRGRGIAREAATRYAA